MNNTHGGKRENAGRKKTTGRTVRQAGCTLDAVSYEQLVALAKSQGKSVSQVLIDALRRHAAFILTGSL